MIMGGGPAGTTAATLLAQQGHDVAILEKAKFPRHHIGESLMPQTFAIFERLGVIDKLRASSYPRKQSVQFVSADGRESQPYLFTDRDPGEWSTTWQVKRDEFDRMMLDHAREAGTVVLENTSAKSVIFDNGRAVGVRAEADGQATEIRAQVVVDATGQSSLLAKQLGIYRPDPDLRNASIYAYFKGGRRDQGAAAGGTIIVHTPQRTGWFWFIPLPDNVNSIGVVAPPTLLFGGRGDNPQQTLLEEIANCPHMAKRLADAELVSPAFVTSDFSYRASRLAGDGWVLVGDAFGFLDPVYSSGVMLALKSGEFAADAIHDGLAAGDLSGNQLGRFAPEFVRGMQLIRQLVYVFYDRQFSFAKFSRDYPELQDYLVRILIGDVFNDEVGALFDTMGKFVQLPAPIELDLQTETPCEN